MGKYYAHMKNFETGKDAYTTTWCISAIREWIDRHEKRGFILMEHNF